MLAGTLSRLSEHVLETESSVCLLRTLHIASKQLLRGARLTSACSRPPTAPRAKYPGACIVSLVGVDLPVGVSGQRCSGAVVALGLPRLWVQHAGG